MTNYKDYRFDVELTVSDQANPDDLIFQIDDEAAAAGWITYAVGDPRSLYIQIVGDSNEITPRGRDSFCKWLAALDGVTRCRSTGIHSVRADAPPFVHDYTCGPG